MKINGKQNIRLIKIILLFSIIILFLILCLLHYSNSFEWFVIDFGEHLVNRSLDHEIWLERFKGYWIWGITLWYFVAVIFSFYIIPIIKNNIKYALRILIILFLGVFLIFTICMAKYQTFWIDELFIMGVIRKGISWGQMLYYYLTIEITNLPLYAIVQRLWYLISPYGEGWLLLVNIIAVFVGVIFLIKFAYELFDLKYALIVTVICTISTTLIRACALELRSYAFLFCFSVIAISIFWHKLHEQNKHSIILHSIIIVILLYTHYFGALLIFTMGVYELILIIFKKCSIKGLISYCVGGICFVPWFIACMILKQKSISNFWPPIPTLRSVYTLLMYLLSNNKLLIFFFALGIAFSVYTLIKREEGADFRVFLAFSTLSIMAIIYIYSAIINPKGSIWVEKYFLAFLPNIILIVGYGIYIVDYYLSGWNHFVIIALTSIIITMGIKSYDECIMYPHAYYDDYKNIALYIQKEYDKQPDTNSIVGIDTYDMVLEGIKEYYLFDCSWDITNDFERLSREFDKYDKVYIWNLSKEKLNGINNDNYISINKHLNHKLNR